MRSALMSRSLISAFALLLAACGSDGPSAPTPPGDDGPEPVILSIGDTVSLALAPGQREQKHRITVAASTEIAVFIQSDSNMMLASTIDSAWVASNTMSYGGYPLLLTRTERIIIPAGKTLSLTVQRNNPDSVRAAYRLFVYRVNRAPEHGPATITPGVVRSDEDLETSADIDEFALTPFAGQEVIGYVATVGPATPGQFALQLGTAGGDLFGYPWVNAPADGVPLEDNASSSFPVPLTGAYVVRVLGTMSARPRYQFLVRRLVRAPETAGDSVGTSGVISESMDYTGDVDEFAIHGAAGKQFNLLLESDTLPQGVLETFGEGAPYGRAFLGASAWQASTGMLTIPASGQIAIRMSSHRLDGETGRGAYRIRVVPVNPAPETASAALTGTDSVLTESIERWADRDEFTLNWPTDGLVNLVLQHDNTQGPLRMDLLPMTGDVPVGSSAPQPNGPGSGRFFLPAGTYRLRVIGNSYNNDTGPFTGPYRAYVYRISEAPETGPTTLSLGAVVNEAINPIGDRDTFHLAVPPGELFRIRFDVSSPSAQGLTADYRDDGPIYPGGPAFVVSPGGVSMPTTAEANDVRRLAVYAYNGNSDDHGSYALRVEAVPLTPESNPASLGIGSTVTEALPEGDVDQYDLIGAPNAEFALSLLFTDINYYLCARALAPDSPTVLGAIGGSNQQDIGSGIPARRHRSCAHSRVVRPRLPQSGAI